MTRIRKRWALAVLIAVVLLIVFLLWPPGAPPTAGAVKLTLIGYTNAPNNSRRFALFSVTNRADYGIRWWGDWVEIEGSSERKAKVVNPALPGSQRGPVLENAGDLILAVGVPIDPPETGRWRYCMTFSRYSMDVRWLDFSFRHNLRLKLGPFKLVDDQRILNPTNHVTSSSEWIGN